MSSSGDSRPRKNKRKRLLGRKLGGGRSCREGLCCQARDFSESTLLFRVRENRRLVRRLG